MKKIGVFILSFMFLMGSLMPAFAEAKKPVKNAKHGQIKPNKKHKKVKIGRAHV